MRHGNLFTIASPTSDLDSVYQHWDVTDKKGRKVKEVDFNGRQIWPGGRKNKNKGI